MKIIRLLFLFAFVAIFAAACKKVKVEPPVVIHGQVFLVLRSGEAVKLALATVSLVKEADALLAVDAAEKQTAGTLEVARTDLDQELSVVSREIAAKREALRKKQEALLAEAEAMREKRDFSGAYAAKVAEANQVGVELARGDGLKEKSEAIRKSHDGALRNYPNEFAEALVAATTATAMTRTNADGEFTLQLPPGPERVAILIEATRELESVERFVWFVWADKLTPDSGVYLFSNHNFLNAGGDANVVDLSALMREH